jgi:hypothetical protein
MEAHAQDALFAEQRLSERVGLTLAGKLFVPAEEETLDCTVVNLSTGGAGLYCPELPPLDAFVVLYVDGFGRFEGVTTRYEEGRLGLKFICKEAKRKRLEQDLAVFIQEGMVGITRLRRYPRAATANTASSFIRANGEAVSCELQDVSFQGAMLKTDVRPPVGEVIHLGQTRGWVVRHHQEGIGVQFQQRMEQPGQVHG